VTLWGLAFKPNTDDIREAPALTIIDGLLAEGVRVQVHDPEALKEVKKRYGGKIGYFENNYDALADADALVIVTEWNEFRRPDYLRMKSLMKQPVIFDGRNIYDPAKLKAAGFTYYGMGRSGA
jgi:UDPglucose 6-dehydrogenase